MNDRSPKAIGDRLRITREALRLKQTEFCDAAGVSRSAYNQNEKGGTRPSIDHALAFCDAHGLTLDWIYRGDMTDLPPKLQQAIRLLHKLRDEP